MTQASYLHLQLTFKAHILGEYLTIFTSKYIQACK